MGNKLLKELIEQNKSKSIKNENNEIVKEVNQFLLEAHKEDENILHFIGLDHQIEYTRKLKEDIDRTKQSEEIYKQESFTGEEIKKLCNLYNLRMLRAQFYNGSIPSDLVKKLKEFSDKTDTPLADSDNYFILAPTEQFNTIKHVPIKQDPILFYRSEVSYSKYGEATKYDMFVQVHNWGNDFSSTRKYWKLFNTYIYNHDEVSNLTFTIWATSIYLILFISSGLLGNFILSLSVTIIYLFILSVIYSNNTSIDNLWNTNTT